MRALFDVIVEKRKLVLTFMLVLCVICACLIPSVRVNSDIASYLPDDSSMKQGVDIISEEFPDQASQSIRVMFKDLPADEEQAIYDDLSSIEHVSRVAWEADSPDYHKDSYTLYTIYTQAAYDSPEEISIEETVEQHYEAYDFQMLSANTASDVIPVHVLLIAVLLIVVVLIIMCHSAFEPLLILLTVGCAIALNFGSNIIQGEISSVTLSIAAILQLALSIDYSVILLNRYRLELSQLKASENVKSSYFAQESYQETYQEQEQEQKPKKGPQSIHIEAMKRALTGSCSAIASSGITTVVGLLALVFMSFKIGGDIGIVLGKGIALTLLCVFTILPSLVLASNRLIEKTQKKVPHFAMKAAGAVAHKGRFIFSGAFVALMVVAYFAQNITSLSYTLEEEDPIADIFGANNDIVLVYENSSEAEIAQLENAFNDNESVKNVNGYSNTLGKPYTAAEFESEITALSGADAGELFDPSVISMLFYDAYDGNIYPLTAETFLAFIQNDVLQNPSFSAQINDETKGQFSQLDKFAHKEELVLQRDIASMASFLGMSNSDLAQLYLAYGIQTGAYTPQASLTLAEFVSFLQNTVVNNPSYSNSIPAEQAAQLESMQAFLDVEATTTPLSSQEAASYLGIDEAQMQLIYLNYFVAQGACASDTMTVMDFVQFLQTDVAQNPLFANYAQDINPEELAQLVQYAQMNGITQALDSYSMAELLGMDASQLAFLYGYHHLLYGDTNTWLISIQDLLYFMLQDGSITASLSAEQIDGLSFASAIIDSNVAEIRYNYQDMATFMRMDASSLYQLYLLNDYTQGRTQNWSASVQQILAFICDSLLANDTYSQMLQGMDTSQIYAARMLCDAVVSGQEYSPEEMSNLLSSLAAYENDSSISLSDINLLYLYWASEHYGNDEWTMSMESFADYLSNTTLHDERFASWIDEEQSTQIVDMNEEIISAKRQMVGDQYSIMQISLRPEVGSEESSLVLDQLDAWLTENSSGEYHLVGNSVMAWEMEDSFGDEMRFITLLTAIAIFLVVALTFRNLLIPLILVAIVECGVWITITVIGLQGYSIYYLALVVVQCILMGATIDYGILFTSTYREQRATLSIPEALSKAYSISIHTVLTSGIILVLVCGIVGTLFENPTIGQICTTISIGAFCTIILILLFLPGLLAAMDKGTAGKNRLRE